MSVGLQPNDYITILSNLRVWSEGVEIKNISGAGITSEDVLTYLEENKKELRNTKVVLLKIVS